MHLSFSLISSAVLAIGYLTNTALCVPTNEPSKLMVNNNFQQPLHSTCNSTVTAIDVFDMLIPWMRQGLDPYTNYLVVTGEGAPLVKDHFIELQFIRNFLLRYTNIMSIDAFDTVVQAANSINNVFQINSDLNNYKSRVRLSQYVGDARIHTYLCSGFTNGDGTLVGQRAQAFLNGLIQSEDPSVHEIGTRINAAIALGNLHCP